MNTLKRLDGDTNSLRFQSFILTLHGHARLTLPGLLVLVLLLGFAPLSAQNHMDLVNTFYGEFPGSWFGYNVVAMDYNGDDYDDLIVCARYWNPTGVYDSGQQWGKIYFYWGGEVFDNSPDFVIEGTENGRYSNCKILNGGDINGDGIDDLVFTKFLPTTFEFQIIVSYGKTNPTAIPDLIITPIEPLDDYLFPFALGDITGDGHADLACRISPFAQAYDKLIVWTGENHPLYNLASTTNGTVAISANGVGDVNADGLADFILQYGIPGGSNFNSRLVLFYGNSNYPVCDSLVISENTNQILTRQSSPLGDLNNDGYADFNSLVDEVWFGCSELSPISDITLSINDEYHNWYNPGYNKNNPFVYGDLNGDGYDDIIGSCYDIYYYTGEAALWIGGPNMDGLRDLYLHPPDDYHTCNFGWDKAAGDFNNDGLCDLAISAPMYYSAPLWAEGRVYIYSGNSDLADTTVAINDELQPEQLIKVYPNPASAGTDAAINFRFPEAPAGSGGEARVTLYDIKGRKVAEHVLSPSELLCGQGTLRTDRLAPGIYLAACRINGVRLSLKRLTVM